MSENPFQSPAAIEEPNTSLAATNELPPITSQLFARTTLRWIIICGVAAIPSFMLGLAVTQATPAGITAMCVGILLFGIGYSLCDLYMIRRWCFNSPSFHRSLRIGLGFRLAASVIVPIGVCVDMYPGLAAVGIFDAFGGMEVGGQTVSFPIVIMITLLQGVFMNILLYGFVLFVFGIIRLTNGELFRTRSETLSREASAA